MNKTESEVIAIENAAMYSRRKSRINSAIIAVVACCVALPLLIVLQDQLGELWLYLRIIFR